MRHVKNAYYIMLHDNKETQFTVKYTSYINATTGLLRASDSTSYSILRALQMFYITLHYMTDLLAYYYVGTFTNTKRDPTHPIRYNFTRRGCSFMS